MLSAEPPYLSPACRLGEFLSVAGRVGASSSAATTASFASPNPARQTAPRPSRALFAEPTRTSK